MSPEEKTAYEFHWNRCQEFKLGHVEYDESWYTYSFEILMELHRKYPKLRDTIGGKTI